jgi:CHAT domain-containing protein/tetratricopeptide (TPR) repeat protein
MTHAKLWVPAIGTAILCACSPHGSVPNGASILDEDVALVRDGDKPDAATRELSVQQDSILVAFVDENLTDVTLELTVVDPDSGTSPPVAVENNAVGSGVEIAAVDARDGARVRVTLTGPQDATSPGKVHLLVRQFAASAARDEQFAAQLAAFRSWTAATRATLRADDVKKSGLPEIQKAIDGLESKQGDPVLAAQARLTRATLLASFRIDWRDARAEAQRAANEFAHLAKPDALNEARARLAEARALAEMSNDRDAKNPTADEASKIAHEIIDRLSAPETVFGPIERARAISVKGSMNLSSMLVDEANRNFEAARGLFAAAGYSAGEREMRCKLAMVLVEQGKFADAARLFDAMLPEIDRISRPELRVVALLTAARSFTFSGRTDEGADLMLKALPVAQEYQLRQQEGDALQGLSYFYQLRGDLLQASAFSTEALKIAREQNDVIQYMEGLVSAGVAARATGDYATAFKYHKEAVRLAPNPVAQVRTRLDLGVDYYRIEDLPNAMASYREALAIDLHDPMSHVYSDAKLGLAQFIAEYDKSTPQELAEADKLAAEAMQTALKVRSPFYVIFATEIKAQVDARQGRLAAARAGFERVLKLGQEYRERSASIEARSNILVDEQHAFRGYLDIEFADVAKSGPGIFRPATAAELSLMRRLERTRYESFGALRVGLLDAQTSARMDALLEQMAQKSLRIASLAQGDLASGQAAELQQLQLDMARMHAELDHERTSAAIKQANAAGLASTEARAFRPVPPGAAQLSYALSANHVYALVRSASGARVAVLAPSRKALEEELTALAGLDVQTSSPKIEAALEHLSAELMPAGLLPENSAAVDIVAEGRIASVPFAALRSPTNPERRLAETHVVEMVTSLFDADDVPRARQARPYRFVALASGQGTYRQAVANPAPQLQAATKEIRLAANLFAARDAGARIKLLVGAEGTAAALHDIWSSGADVVHFATHALADLRQPIASLLVLPATDAGGKSTYLTAGQVQAWRGDTELVFLSACESAIGPPQYAAGMPGLQRAFLRAGARGVIATLAPIEDVLAQEFSADFYSHYTAGQSAAQALADTQRAWIVPRAGESADTQLRRRITALSHAYFSR